MCSIAEPRHGGGRGLGGLGAGERRGGGGRGRAGLAGRAVAVPLARAARLAALRAHHAAHARPHQGQLHPTISYTNIRLALTFL